MSAANWVGPCQKGVEAQTRIPVDILIESNLQTEKTNREKHGNRNVVMSFWVWIISYGYRGNVA